jgi:hypothetical protein
MMGKKNKNLVDSEQAKKFLREAGDEFETEGRKLVKDDYAAIRSVKTASEMCEKIDALMLARMENEITVEEANRGINILRKLLGNDSQRERTG